MSQKFNQENGDMVPVTAIKCGPCVVIQKRAKDKEGYESLQLGFEEVKKLQNVTRARKGHFQKAKTPVFRYLGEWKVDKIDHVDVGDRLSIEMLKVGDFVNVSGVTKGRGYQGVIKRHGKHGGPAAHGSNFHRAPGSIGMRTSPGRVLKNMKLPGHMGDCNRTAKNIEVIEIDVENNLLFVKGAVPGCNNGLLRVTNTGAKLAERFKKEGKPEVETKTE